MKTILQYEVQKLLADLILSYQMTDVLHNLLEIKTIRNVTFSDACNTYIDNK